ncbi:hypothetical protein DSO57_1024200 [Entomophthora muscae]|uniref:Uncharacterized protein n=1 Tax=Entomophthora muscae TaxID=34485 RepID=A0ACC2SFA8_9FUNG|nr:hypothetical protein DSO57_1024200 [Entomophthora muscae]
MEIEEIFKLFQTAIQETWEPMNISFTPEEFYASALKKFQDSNSLALSIPALVNHQKPEDKLKKKMLINKAETGLPAKNILANTKIKKRRTHEVMLTGYGALRVDRTLEGVPNKVILDGSAYTK